MCIWFSKVVLDPAMAAILRSLQDILVSRSHTRRKPRLHLLNESLSPLIKGYMVHEWVKHRTVAQGLFPRTTWWGLGSKTTWIAGTMSQILGYHVDNVLSPPPCVSPGVGLFSLVLGLVCAQCCCRNTAHTPRSRNKLMDLEMDWQTVSPAPTHCSAHKKHHHTHNRHTPIDDFWDTQLFPSDGRWEWNDKIAFGKTDRS